MLFIIRLVDESSNFPSSDIKLCCSTRFTWIKDDVKCTKYFSTLLFVVIHQYCKWRIQIFLAIWFDLGFLALFSKSDLLQKLVCKMRRLLKLFVFLVPIKWYPQLMNKFMHIPACKKHTKTSRVSYGICFHTTKKYLGWILWPFAIGASFPDIFFSIGKIQSMQPLQCSKL